MNCIWVKRDEICPTHITSGGENFAPSPKKGKNENKLQSLNSIKFNIFSSISSVLSFMSDLFQTSKLSTESRRETKKSVKWQYQRSGSLNQCWKEFSVTGFDRETLSLRVRIGDNIRLQYSIQSTGCIWCLHSNDIEPWVYELAFIPVGIFFLFPFSPLRS